MDQVPKRKPQALSKKTDKPKPIIQPKKWAPFTARDSRSIEGTLQKLAKEEDIKRNNRISTITGDITDTSSHVQHTFTTFGRQGSLRGTRPDLPQKTSTKVPVNEDFLFDVDIDTRELGPAYWLGPIYEVRRGSWFYNDGASNKPCDENLATQLEEGYLKARPWLYETPVPTRSSSQSKRPLSWKPAETSSKLGATNIKPPRQSSVDAVKTRIKEEEAAAATAANPVSASSKFELSTHRLFGAHMNSVVTYQDENTAWIVTDDFLSRMSTTMYQRFAGGGHFGGIKVVRGFVDTSGKKETKPEDAPVTADLGDGEERGRSTGTHKRAGSRSRERMPPPSINIEKTKESGSDRTRFELERRMTTIIGSPSFEDPAAQEEEARKREENEIQQDYRDHDSDDQGREIEHLVLCTHGIGQRLGLKMESLNFIHDVNVLRKTLKSVYDMSPDLQSLNSDLDKLPKNCRVQVLPIVWRHLLDFPREMLKKDGKEQDLSDTDALNQELDYPRLQDITVEGVPAIRNLVEDLFLDILLYQSGYRDHIASIVQRECNRVYKLFIERNPNFKGKISLVGHSLGSAIMFDILCRQKQREKPAGAPPKRHGSRRFTNPPKLKEESNELALDFDVEDFYALGSPIGLFQMIEGRTVVGRRDATVMEANGTVDHIAANESFRKVSGANDPDEPSSASSTISSPKCAQVFNIFHPTDPVAYRVEPLISPAMKALKPQPLPFTKRGLFYAPVAGLSGIGTRVGQSVSGFWSNITTGVASSLLNRSLGLSNDPTLVSAQTRQPLSLSAAAHLAAAANTSSSQEPREQSSKDEEKTRDQEEAGPGLVAHPATLIDSEIETLYSGFQRRRNTLKGSQDPRENLEYLEAEERAKQYRREEAKVRALNSTGRVDFSIQESVNPLPLFAIANNSSQGSLRYLSYWQSCQSLILLGR